jgi:toxin ParE1/3/4
VARFRLSQRARRDLAEIWRYSAERWSEAQADRYYGALIDAIEILADRPGLARDVADLRPGYRSMPCRSHVIFFRMTDNRGIEVMRILHQRMDVRARLWES